MTSFQQSTSPTFRSSSPSPSIHYESSYLKRTKKKPPPSLSSIQNYAIPESSSVSVSSLPISQHQNIQSRRSLTPMRNFVQPMRAQSPIDMILDNSRRRAATPLGTQQNSNRSIAATPLSFMRSPSPTMSVQSMPYILYSQRVLGTSSRVNDYFTNLQLQKQHSYASPQLPSQRNFNISTRHQVPHPTDALSPSSQDAFIGVGSPEQQAASPTQSHQIGHQSPDAFISVRSPEQQTLSPPKSHLVDHMKPTRASKNHSPDNQVKSLSLQTTQMKQDTRDEDENDKKEEGIRVNSSHDSSKASKSNKSTGRRRRKIQKYKWQATRKEADDESTGIKFDPEQPDRYWAQVAVRVSADIIKSGSGKKYQIFAEAAQLSVLKSSVGLTDNSPEIINLVASKASMAVLEAGGDAKVAALATIAILNAEKDIPSTDEQVKAKMVELYGSARDLVKKSYDDGSRALTTFSEIATTKLQEVARDNVERRKSLEDGPSHRGKRNTPTFMDVVDGIVSDIKYQLNLDDYEWGSRRRRKRGGYRDYSSDEYSYESDRRRRLGGRGHHRVLVSSSSSYSDDSRDYERPRMSTLRKAPLSRRSYDDDVSVEKERYYSRSLRRGRRSNSYSSESSASSYRNKARTKKTSKTKRKRHINSSNSPANASSESSSSAAISVTRDSATKASSNSSRSKRSFEV